MIWIMKITNPISNKKMEILVLLPNTTSQVVKESQMKGRAGTTILSVKVSLSTQTKKIIQLLK